MANSAWLLNARHTDRILSDRLLPAELGRVIAIQDHLDDRDGGEFCEVPLPAFYPTPQSSPRPIPQLHRKRFIERVTERESKRDYFACSELAVASRGRHCRRGGNSFLCMRRNLLQVCVAQPPHPPTPPLPCLLGFMTCHLSRSWGGEGGEEKRG